jgi:hypothetical protein
VGLASQKKMTNRWNWPTTIRLSYNKYYSSKSLVTSKHDETSDKGEMEGGLWSALEHFQERRCTKAI